MKKIIWIFLLCISGIYASGQAKPAYTQYVLNNYILNPALSGIENYTDIKLSLRNQWTGINGAPVTSYVSVHAPVGNQTTIQLQHLLKCPAKTHVASSIGMTIRHLRRIMVLVSMQ